MGKIVEVRFFFCLVYFDTWSIFNIYFKNLTVKAQIITIADDIFCNNFLHIGNKKID